MHFLPYRNLLSCWFIMCQEAKRDMLKAILIVFGIQY